MIHMVNLLYICTKKKAINPLIPEIGLANFEPEHFGGFMKYFYCYVSSFYPFK